MEKQPKILMRNLYWAYGKKTGAVPYIFNKDKSAIKLYHKDYNFDVLNLDRKGMPRSQQLFEALNTYFGEDFTLISSIKVYEYGLPAFEQVVRHAIYGAYDFQPFSQKDIETMQKRYNKHMQRKLQKEEEKKQRYTAKREKQDATQDVIMDF